MHLEYLEDRPEFIPTIARWHFHEWGHLRPGDSVEARILRLQGCCGRRRVPQTVIAVLENELLGSASLIEHDMESRLDLTPWLAGVFVPPQHRRKGIGAALVRRTMAEATSLDVSTLYLYTLDSTAFYASLGWSQVEKTRYQEKEVSIMSFSTRTRTP